MKYFRNDRENMEAEKLINRRAVDIFRGWDIKPATSKLGQITNEHLLFLLL